jgi:hypothetical protein
MLGTFRYTRKLTLISHHRPARCRKCPTSINRINPTRKLQIEKMRIRLRRLINRRPITLALAHSGEKHLITVLVDRIVRLNWLRHKHKIDPGSIFRADGKLVLDDCAGDAPSPGRAVRCAAETENVQGIDLGGRLLGRESGHDALLRKRTVLDVLLAP